MRFANAATFDDAITAAGKVRGATSYVVPASGSSNSVYSNGAFEAYTPPGAYADGARPGYGFHASGSFGTYLYAQTSADLRIRTDSGLDYQLWHAGNTRSDAQNDARYSQLGHTHIIANVTGLQAALDAKLTGSGTVNQLAMFTATGVAGNSIVSQSGINVTAAGQFISDVAPSGSGSRGFGFFAAGSPRWTIGKFGLETGSDAGSNLVFYRFNDAGGFLGEAMNINRATGNVTFSGTITASGGNSTNWNTAFSWGNHASAGYVPTSRTLTINGTTYDLSANRSWTVAGGVGGSGTTGFIPKWNGANLTNSSIDDSDVNYLNTTKGLNAGKLAGNWSVTLEGGTSNANVLFNHPTLLGGYQIAGGGDGISFVGYGSGFPGYIMGVLSNGNVRVAKQIDMVIATGTAPFFVASTTMSPNLNADMVDGLHASSFALASSLSGSAGRLAQFTSGTTLADSMVSISGVNVTANSGQFASDAAPAAGPRGLVLMNSTNRWSLGKLGSETGSDAGSDLVFIRYSDSGTLLGTAFTMNRATGNATFSGTITASGGNSTNWNTAYTWGNHASAGYVPTSRTLTINGTAFDLSANRSWTISTGGGIAGSGTAGRIPQLTASTTIGNSIMYQSGGAIIADGEYISDYAPDGSITRGLAMRTNSSVYRWSLGKFGLESGSNSGSDFSLFRYSDAGAFLGEALRIIRSSGNATFSGSITASGGNSTNWNTAYSWGNHAGAGYITLSYLSSNYYSKTTIDSMVSGYVPDSRQVLGTGSIQGGGNLGVNRSFNLYGDQDNPGANKLYGTDGSGNKGWYTQPSGGGGVPTSRVLTINGVSYDLSLDRSWTVSGGISGGGTNGYIPLWNSGSSLTNSVISQFGSLITIGNSGAAYHLNMWGDVLLRSESASFLSSYSPSSEGALVYQYDGTKGVYCYYSGSWHHLG